ncbi:MAG: hypothetical protein F4X40_09720 [Chloroflexi bacterium]|nr:hypothetical protein [Chloroflexota bacterium]
MNRIYVNDPYRRLIAVLTASVALTLIALVPAYLASQVTDEPKTVHDGIARMNTAAEPEPEMDGATVMLNSSINDRVPSHLSWYSADIIRNGVLIKEDFVRPGDVLSLATLDTAAFRNLPTDGDECATILRLYADGVIEIAEQRSGWQLNYLLVADEDTATLHRCSIPRIESAK